MLSYFCAVPNVHGQRVFSPSTIYIINRSIGGIVMVIDQARPGARGGILGVALACLAMLAVASMPARGETAMRSLRSM